MERIKLSPKSFKWLLIIGAALCAIPLLIEVLCFNSGFHFFGQSGLIFGQKGLQHDTSINMEFRWHGIVFFLVTMLIILPIIEELAFRFWAIGKNIVFFLVSLILITAYMLFACGWIWAAVAFVALALTYLITKNNGNVRIVSLLIVTSVLFSIAYSLGCEAPLGITILDMIKNLGFSFLAGIVVLQCRFGFLWAVLLHIVLNVINIVPALYEHTYETDDYIVSVKPMLDLSLDKGYYGYEDEPGFYLNRGALEEIVSYAASSQTIYDNPSEIVEKIMYQSTFYQTHFYSATPLEVKITDKKGKKNNAELNHSLLQFLITEKIISSDTSFVPMQYLQIDDIELFNAKNDTTPATDSRYIGDLHNLILTLRFVYNLPLQPAQDVNYLCPFRIENTFVRGISLDEAKAILKERGLSIVENPHSRAQIIEYNYFW
ncbi:MAG: hypothetical protein IKQ94_05010 [Bacteroidales bacterium]|nr:hypothetical protein [Bacteroidales bacterium]